MGAYEALQLGQAGNEECPDKYNAASTLLCPGMQTLTLQIAAHGIVLQVGYMAQGQGQGLGSVVWQPEEPYQPVVGILNRRFDAIRVRNLVAGAKAEVILIVDRR